VPGHSVHMQVILTIKWPVKPPLGRLRHEETNEINFGSSSPRCSKTSFTCILASHTSVISGKVIDKSWGGCILGCA